jgi:hypothetical protein
MSMPEEVRKEAAKEFIRLKMLEQPAPVAPVVPAAPLVPDFSELIAAAKEREIKAKAKPANPESETQTFTHDAEVSRREPTESELTKPEPLEREKGSTWRIDGREHIYLCLDRETKMHMLVEVRPTSGLLPETIKISEERLVGVRHTAQPRARGYETVAEFRARRRNEQHAEQMKWNIAMGVSGYASTLVPSARWHKRTPRLHKPRKQHE